MNKPGVQLLRGLFAAAFATFTFGAQMAAAQTSQTDTNAIQAEMDTAIHQVERIVNQPVAAYRRTPGMHFGVSSEGWFHPGAAKPDFNNVDVRTTQETPYASHQYITSDLNPGVVFLGSQLEFNSMTKYFYTNRSLPKKKLTEAEMLEINRLYRIIGRCEQQLGQRTSGTTTAAEQTDQNGSESSAPGATRSRLLNPYIGGGAIALLGVLLLLSFSRRGR
jgi:hypothetical protein